MTFDSATQLTAITGAHAVGIVDVVITNPDFESSTSTGGFEYTFANCDGSVLCIVGDTGTAGGTIFYVATDTFTSIGSLCSDTCKYIEYADPAWNGGSDPQISWQQSGVGVEYVPGTANVLGAGMYNSLLISQYTTHGDSSNVAALAALNYAGSDVTSLGDWYLPSAPDLSALYSSGIYAAGNFATGLDAPSRYWTSLQNSTSEAFAYSFGHDYFYQNPNKGSSYLVRPFRAFGAAKPAAPIIDTSTVISQPALDVAPGQVGITADSTIEYSIVDITRAVTKLTWTQGGTLANTNASPTLVPGDLIRFRVKAAGLTAASSEYIYTIQAGDIGQATPVAIANIKTNTDGTKIYITYDGVLNASKVPNLADFAMSINGLGSINPTAISISGVYMDLTFGTSFLSPDAITLSYAQSVGNEIQGLFGNLAADSSSIVVTNEVVVVTITTSTPTISISSFPATASISSGFYPTPALKSGVTAGDFIFDFGTTELVLHTVTDVSGVVTFTFATGSNPPAVGTITVQAKKSAFEGTSVVVSNVLSFTVVS